MMSNIQTALVPVSGWTAKPLSVYVTQRGSLPAVVASASTPPALAGLPRGLPRGKVVPLAGV
jgi:hypothetical protein